MSDDLVTATVKRLTADATVASLATATPPITQEQPYNIVEGSGTLQLVVSTAGQWTVPLAQRTQRFPVLRVEAWSDPTRNVDGNVTIPDASRKARAALDAVIEALRMVNNGQTWGDGFTVLSCHLRTEPVEVPLPIGEDEMKRWRVEFAVTHP
jgi:poly(3-hydroxybutyrate) depolymerase